MTVGETHTPTITFKDADNVLYAPDTVTVTIRRPNGTTFAGTVTNPSLGIYQATFPLTAKGVWRFEFTGTGPSPAVVVESGYVCVEEAIAA